MSFSEYYIVDVENVVIIHIGFLKKGRRVGKKCKIPGNSTI